MKNLIRHFLLISIFLFSKDIFGQTTDVAQDAVNQVAPTAVVVSVGDVSKEDASVQRDGYYKDCYFTPIVDKETKFDKSLKLSCYALGDMYLEIGDANNSQLAFKEGCRGEDQNACIRYADLLKKGSKLREATAIYQRACTKGSEAGCAKLKEREISEYLMWFAIILIGIGVFLIARTIFIDEDQYQASAQLDDGVKKEDLGKHGIILKYSRPFFRRYISPIVSTLKGRVKIRERYKRPLASSGLTQFLTADDFFSFKLFLIIGFPLGFLALRAFLEKTWPLSYLPLVALFGFFYPDLWIRGKIKQRQDEIISAMPFVVDMLALTVEAGLDFVQAMSRVVDKARPGPLTEEFEILIKEIRVGASRAEGLRNMAWRINLIQVSSFCATLIAADQMGANISPILKSLSNEIRQKRSTEIEKKGATAATKILFPMIFLIMPAVGLIIMAPLAFDWLGLK